MSYLALARKWRPRTFLQLVGQEHINTVLIKSLDQQRLHHAYLFTGTRGVGKTSMARLMAKALNCEQGVSSKPCLKCNTCVAIEQNCFFDLIEIDGASKTRVEDTRELLENIQYAPTSGRFKIYLIDEVHMLSTHSFNALLKTLEEPPMHVKFLLATTDPQKLPATVLSRCLQFSLKHLTIETIVKQLIEILTEEQLEFDNEALQLLAKSAHGSMRDALSLLDQAIAGVDKHLYVTDVKAMLGYSQQNYAPKLLQALAELNAVQLITICRQIASEGSYFNYVLEELLDYLHQITICQNLSDNHHLSNSSPDIASLARQFKAEDIQLFYQIGIKGVNEISLAPTLSIGFEMVMLRMLTFRPAPSVPTPRLAYEITDKNKSIESKTILKQEQAAERPQTITTKSLKTLTTSNVTSANFSLTPINAVPIKDWGRVISQIKLTGLAQTAAENAEFISENGNEVILQAAKGHQSLFSFNVIQKIEQALSNYYHNTVKIRLNFNDITRSSPAQEKQQKHLLHQQEAEINLQQDSFFQQLKQEFSAELVKNSVESLQNPL